MISIERKHNAYYLRFNLQSGDLKWTILQVIRDTIIQVIGGVGAQVYKPYDFEIFLLKLSTMEAIRQDLKRNSLLFRMEETLLLNDIESNVP